MFDLHASRRRRSRFVLPAALMLVLSIPGIGDAGQAALAITSPADGSVVSPGQTVSVTVTSPAGLTFTSLGVSADDPIGPIGVSTSAPAQFTFEVPATAPSRKYTLTASGMTSAGESAFVTIDIDVERPDMPGLISARLPEIVFEVPGVTSPITILGTFADGTVLNVTRSTNMTYVSSDPAVATVDAGGVVMAVAPGSAEITAAYGPAAANLRATIPVQVPDPPFTVSPNPLDFGSQAVGTSAARQITIANTSGGPLTIVSVTAADDFAVTDTCVASSPLAVDATCAITVTFTPTEAGERAGVAEIRNSLTTIGVNLTGTGVAGPLLAITGFTPAAGVAGTSVTITGTNFELVPSANSVKFNTTNAVPTASTATTVTVPVPARAGSGRITFTTALGTAVSSDDFIVPPAPYGAADVAVSGRIPFATATTVTVSTAGQIGLMLFEGTAGQRISLRGTNGMSGQDPGCDVNVAIRKPNNAVLASGTCMEVEGFIDVKTLPLTGTYAIVVDPAGPAVGSVTLTLYDVPPDVTGTIVPGGPGATISATTPGQDSSLTFSGAAGQRVSLQGSNGMNGQLPACDVKVSIRNPDGTALAGATCMEGDDFIDVRTLPATGTYSIVVNPVKHATGGMTLTLHDVPPDTTGTVDAGGAAVAVPLATPGQSGSLTFNGTSGQQVTVRLSGNTFGQVTVRLLAPDGTQLASKTAAAQSFKLAAQTLPASGAYIVVISPVGANTGTISVNITSP